MQVCIYVYNNLLYKASHSICGAVTIKFRQKIFCKSLTDLSLISDATICTVPYTEIKLPIIESFET